MKIGKTDFNQFVIKKMTFGAFKKMFRHLLIDHKSVFLQLGGKIDISEKYEKLKPKPVID